MRTLSLINFPLNIFAQNVFEPHEGAKVNMLTHTYPHKPESD